MEDMNDNITIKKFNKKYGKRKIQVFDEKNKKLGEITEYQGWICLGPPEQWLTLRKTAIENLWWLLHTDNLDEDTTEEEAWKEKCDRWTKGNTNFFDKDEEPTSLFFPHEYEIALNSINNK